MSVASMLVGTLAVQRGSSTRDASGGARTTFAVVVGLEEVPCSIHPSSARTKLQYAQQQLFVSHRVYVDQDYGIKRGDRLLAGTQYYVVHGVGDFGGRGRLWFLDCEAQQ